MATQKFQVYTHDRMVDVECEIATDKKTGMKYLQIGQGWARDNNWCRYHPYLEPRRGDLVRHEASGRVFVVANISGFVACHADLMEKGQKVCEVHWISYDD